MGRRNICRLTIPGGWDRPGVGRRFFMFPGMSLEEDEVTELRHELMRRAGRSLVMVPAEPMRQAIAQDVQENLDYVTFDAHDIEESKEPFISTDKAVAVVANRYDGIDFPGNDCRLLFIEGLPKATNIQERFLMARMAANVLLNERVQTRVLQAIGRCTRSLEDYSAVVVLGEGLQDYLADHRRLPFLHPELQAEIGFGVEQSMGTTLNDMVENFDTFLANDEDWEEVNELIVAARKMAVQEPFPAMDDLSAVVGHEIDFQSRFWQGDYEGALDCAERVLGGLEAAELRGYRALWHYLAGSAAWLGADAGVEGLTAKARIQFGRAKEAARGIPWLVSLARYQADDKSTADENTILMGQIERVESVLEQLGTVHDRAFAMREKEILIGLASKETFEEAHKLLGEMLGFNAGKVEVDGAPDPWWITGNLCFVFEDHAGAQAGSSLHVKKARQVASHPVWMRANVEASSKADILPVLVTPVTKVDPGAAPHLDDVALWPLEEFRAWAENALATVREVRRTFVEPGDIVWRVAAAEAFEQNGLDASGLFAMLRSRPAAKHLTPTN